MMNSFIKLVKSAPVVKRDDRNLTASPAPFVGKRGNDALDATCIKTIGNEDYFSAEIGPTGYSQLANHSQIIWGEPK